MSNTFFISDPHFGHGNIIKFLGPDGTRIRPFDSIEHHDETLIENWNKTVKPEDRVYVMGDIAMSRKHIKALERCNGRKKLIRGNHDVYKLKDYTPFFDDIVSYRMYPEHRIVVSHIPIHSGQLDHRFKVNVHGHLHINLIEDKRYINLCVEHTNWSPVAFDEVLEMIKERGLNV